MTKDRTQDKRQRILDAALKIFARRGFYTAKVAEVAREAGVADGTIYLYFANKDDLLISLFEDRMDFLIARLTDELAQAGTSVHDRFRALIRVHLRLATQPAFVLDISPYWDQKLAALASYQSQFVTGREHLEVSFLDRQRDEAAYWGKMIGVRYGEPFASREPLGMTTMRGLI